MDQKNTPPSLPQSESTPRPEAVIAFVRESAGAACAACARGVCGHELVVAIAMGFKSTPRCLPCLAAELGKDVRDFREHVREYIERRDCFYAGWRWATASEGFGDARLPGCLWPDSGTLQAARADRSEAASAGVLDPDAPLAAGETPHARWDAGDMACGDLVLELRGRLRSMAPGELLELEARDPGAPEDIPAWCRLTGHGLVMAAHPIYRIRRKSD